MKYSSFWNPEGLKLLFVMFIIISPLRGSGFGLLFVCYNHFMPSAFFFHTVGVFFPDRMHFFLMPLVFLTKYT